jgi:hypothetical protein
LGRSVRFDQRPVRELLSVRLLVAWFDKHAGIVTENLPLSKKLFLTTLAFETFGRNFRTFSHFFRQNGGRTRE